MIAIPYGFEKHPDLIAAPPSADELRDEYPDADSVLVERCMECIKPGVTRGAQYMLMRMGGTSDSLAAMVSLQKGPGLDTDDVFFSGQKPLYDQFGSQKHLDRHLKASKKHGFTPSPNATYFPSLARFQGDPEAYVTRAQGRGYIRKLCERRGWACEGAVKVGHREPDSDPLAPENCVPLAKDVMANRAKQMVKQNPDLKKVPRRELRERILQQHGPQ